MVGDPLLAGSATEALAALRSGRVSALELTETVLERIDAVDGEVNAMASVRRDGALRDAAAADARSGPRGPLHGLPVTVKDAFHVAGLPTTWGNPDWAGAVADTDAIVVRRLLDAGAILLGTTNVAFMLGDFGQTENPLHGRTRNPHDRSRAAGGSSGGSAAALAAGMTYLEHGSDLVGSIRIPAAFCGVYGLRPTPGLVPLTGFAPPGPVAEQSELAHQSVLGPLARTAADLRLALSVSGGPEQPGWSWTLPAPRHRTLTDFRVGVVLDCALAPVTAEVGDVLSAVADAVARTGAIVVEGWPDGVDPGAGFEAFGAQVQAFFAWQDRTAATGSLADFAAQDARRMAHRAAWQRYFQDIDIFLSPVNFTAAPPHDDRPLAERTVAGRPYTDQSFWIAPAGLAGLPALSAPVGHTPDGLPVGLQILTARHQDDTALTFAELVATEILT
ncbi:MAG: amidase family protein [Mycobacteriales bacterium]